MSAVSGRGGNSPTQRPEGGRSHYLPLHHRHGRLQIPCCRSNVFIKLGIERHRRERLGLCATYTDAERKKERKKIDSSLFEGFTPFVRYAYHEKTAKSVYFQHGVTIKITSVCRSRQPKIIILYTRSEKDIIRHSNSLSE